MNCSRKGSFSRLHYWRSFCFALLLAMSSRHSQDGSSLMPMDRSDCLPDRWELRGEQPCQSAVVTVLPIEHLGDKSLTFTSGNAEATAKDWDDSSGIGVILRQDPTPWNTAPALLWRDIASKCFPTPSVSSYR